MESSPPERKQRMAKARKKKTGGSVEAPVPFCYARDFLFCDMCGTLLKLGSPEYAECPLCEFRPSARSIAGKETSYTITAEDIRRQLKISPFVKTDTHVAEEELKWAVTNRPCPKCSHPELEYTNKQLRSADEGQTTFYKCTKCSHQFNENS